MNAVLCTPGATSESLRRAVLEHAFETRRGGGGGGATSRVPPALSHYVDTIVQHAYRVTDADVRALQAAGQSDDSLFEITVVAAVGAAMHRLQRGMAALRGEEPD